MKNVSELSGYMTFHNQGRVLLERFLSSFLNCKVNIQIHDIAQFEKGMGIDVTSNVHRNCYSWGEREDEVIIVPKVYTHTTREIIAILPIRLSGPQMHSFPRRYLEKITRTISVYLTRCAEKRFSNSVTIFGPEFEREMVSRCLSSGYNINQIMYLVDIITKLSRTTFEANDFSTAFIYTHSEHDYAKAHRLGSVIRLSSEYDLLKSPAIDKRFWYFSDGCTSAYLVNSSLKINNLYIYEGRTERFLDSYSLRHTLLGSDILFRVTGTNQVSIIDSGGIEFCNIENKWKLRNYGVLFDIIQKNSDIAHSSIDPLISNVIYCSQNKISSIIWLPKDCSSPQMDCLLAKNYCAFKHNISICEPDKNNLVKRILSSDGVTVIGNTGTILSHGAIVNLNEVKEKGQVGTGESAAKLLSQNGVAIKISQDGNIKLYYLGGQYCLIF